MTSYRKEGPYVSVRGDNGEEVERFESSGCVHRDLGCCQGCPTCMFDDYEDEDEQEDRKQQGLWDEFLKGLEAEAKAKENHDVFQRPFAKEKENFFDPALDEDIPF